MNIVGSYLLDDFHYYVKNNSVYFVNILIKNGADVNVKDDKGSTALILASYKGYADVVKMLIENKAQAGYKIKSSTHLNVVFGGLESEIDINTTANIDTVFRLNSFSFLCFFS